jgi:hypothetical protein
MKTKAKAKVAAAKKRAPKSEFLTEFQDVEFSSDTRALAAIECGRDIIVIRANEYKGKKSLDLRKFYDADGTWAPGKGLSVPDSLAREFLEALESHRPTILRALGIGE